MNENNDDDKRESEDEGVGDGTKALLVIAGMVGFGFFIAFLAKNFHQQLMTFFSVSIILGLGYLLIRYTEATLKIAVFLIVISLVGGALSYCSKRERFHEYDGPGAGFR